MGLLGKIGGAFSSLNPFSGGGGLLGGALDPLGIGGALFGGGGQSMPSAPAPVDNSAGMEAMAEASRANMSMFVGGQVQQTQMQTNLMRLEGQRAQMMAQDKLDAKLEIAGMNAEVKMQEAQYRHDEKLLSLLNTHIEELVDDGMLDPDQFDLA